MPLSLTFMVKIRCISTPDDCDRIFKGALEKKVDMFYQAMQWSQPVDVTKTLDRFF